MSTKNALAGGAPGLQQENDESHHKARKDRNASKENEKAKPLQHPSNEPKKKKRLHGM
jgi:hypothetical protein